MKPARDDHSQSNELTREILHEVCQSARESGQTELLEFAWVLGQLVDLSEGTNPRSGIRRFVTDGLKLIQDLVAEDSLDTDALLRLRAEAIEKWGDRLVAADDTELGMDHSHGEGWNLGRRGTGVQEVIAEPDDVTDDAVPTAEEIQRWIGQLANVSTPASPSSPSSSKPRSSPPEPSKPAGSSGEAKRVEPIAVVSIDSLDPELRAAFLDDAASCVSSMEGSLLRLDADPNDRDALNQICRELHTLKGASASVGLADLADHLHLLEDRLREDHNVGRAPQVDSLLKSVDAIRSQIASSESSSHPSKQDPARPLTDPSAESLAERSTSANDFNDSTNDDETVRVKSSQLNRLMDMLAELVMLRNRRETELSDLQEVYHELIGSVSKMRLLSNEGNVVSDSCTSLQLSEIANDVLEVAQHVRDCARPVAEGNTAVSQFIRQFRQELVTLRRTPVTGLFRRLQRVVRDAALAEGKDVQLQLIGQDAGIERSLQQRLYEPLLHIVRNSVCHGIERPEDRERSGKPRTGTITLEARSGPDLFVVEIHDDGKGLDYDAIRRRGVECGLLASHQLASRDELSQLIFHPGFSTRATANQVAGRGVGMDVVASTIQRMRGWLEIESEPNQGTRIRLSFPLPSVIQHAMVFRSAGQLFAIPMQSVRNVGESDRGAACLSFSKLLGVPSAETSQPIVLAYESTAGQARVALLVDEVVGPEEVVVRPLPTLMKQHPFCAGATLSGMGETVLFLDARRLIESQEAMVASTTSSSSNDLSPASSVSRTGKQRPRVLVVDDSLSARKRVVRSLRRYAAEIVEAGDGKQALEILKTQCFDAIFSDMEMPHVGGMELLAEVRSNDRFDHTPIVIISSRSEAEFTGRARELGATDYLFKPLADDALDRALASIPSLRWLDTETSKTYLMSGDTHER